MRPTEDSVSEPTRTYAFDPPLDPGIAPIVELLVANGIETYESCQGGQGHAYLEPTVRFHGEASKGYEAVAVALSHGLYVISLRRAWEIIDGELTGPHWEMTFRLGRR